MSSMAEGSEGWEREDELDLGHHDDLSEQRDGDHDTLTVGRPEPPPQEPVGEELDTIDPGEDQASENTVDAAGPDLPQTPPIRHAESNATPGSVDETASTPDDTPSLHVSRAIGAHLGFILIGNRVPFFPPKAAVLSQSEALHGPVPVQRIVRSIFASSHGYLRRP